MQQLLPKLESPPFSLRVCLPVRDFAAGSGILEETNKHIALSRKTLVVMTPNFLTNVWGHHELGASHKQVRQATSQASSFGCLRSGVCPDREAV